MCTACEPMLERALAPDQTSWRRLVARVRRAVQDGMLERVEGPPLDTATAPARHVLQCTACAQLFLLERGSRHERVDGWRPLQGN